MATKAQNESGRPQVKTNAYRGQFLVFKTLPTQSPTLAGEIVNRRLVGMLLSDAVGGQSMAFCELMWMDPPDGEIHAIGEVVLAAKKGDRLDLGGRLFSAGVDREGQPRLGLLLDRE